MRRRSPLPMLALGVLTLLAVGAVLLGLFEAPATGDLAVHNAAGEILTAPSVDAVYSQLSPPEIIRVAYRSPGFAKESLIENGKAVRSATASGPKAVKALGPFTQVRDITGFTARGANFVAVKPASSLFRSSVASKVSGSIRYVATVRTGYLIDLVESYRVKTPAGVQTGTDRYRVTAYGGQAVPAP